jgi:hypothetical protein
MKTYTHTHTHSHTHTYTYTGLVETVYAVGTIKNQRTNELYFKPDFGGKCSV